MDRVILHCDLNGFYASVECLSRPALRDVPMAVAGSRENRHGIILAKNEPAKRAGVVTAETITQAKRKCPDLVLVRPHRAEYQKYSRLVNAIYLRYTDRVEPFGIDESYLDLTGIHPWREAAGIADELRRVVRTELGLTISAGVSFCKTFAKLGSDMKKPDATTVISREGFRETVWPLPVSALLYVGKKTQDALYRMHIRTIGELAACDPAYLELRLGKMGRTLWENAAGLDDAPVATWTDTPEVKSVGNGLTFRRNLLGIEDIRTGVAALSDEVAYRLRRHGQKCWTVSVDIKDPDFKTISRQTGLEAPTYLASDIAETALALIRDAWDLKRPIRMLTVTGMNLVDEDEAVEQVSLFGEETRAAREKRERLERAMAGIRDKYGKDVIVPGAALNRELGIAEDEQDDEPE